MSLTTTTEERAQIHLTLFGKPGLVSRKQLRQFVEGKIDEAIAGKTTGPEGDTTPEGTTTAEPKRSGDNCVREFVPSRGDEDYLAQPRDPGIAAACSRILDDTALIETFAWETIERNRK